MDRAMAMEELKFRVKNTSVINISLAVEAIMRAFGRYFRDDEEKWALTGLLHNIDYEKNNRTQNQTGDLAAEILETLGADDYIIYAIKARYDENGLERKRKLDKILYCAIPLANVIFNFLSEVSSVKLEELTVELLQKRLQQSDMITKEERKKIETCEEAAISYDEFITLSLASVQAISFSHALS